MRGLTLTVSQLNEYVRRSLASDPMLHDLCLTGELSNFKRHTSGHWYFTLKDEEAAINCAMFRQAAMGVRFRPENGQRVRLFGSVGLYARTGAYQFYADANPTAWESCICALRRSSRSWLPRACSTRRSKSPCRCSHAA